MSDRVGLTLLVLFSAGAGVVPTCLFGVPRAVSGSTAGTARGLGALMTGRNLGVLAGPVLLAHLVDATGWDSLRPVFGVLTLCTALAAGVLGWWMGRLRR